jgi:hypothetical protein
MRSTFAISIGTVLFVARASMAVPPGPGQPFDCSGGGTTSCASDDTGCVSDTADHAKCASAIGKAFAKAVGTVIKCHGKQATARFKGTDAATAAAAEEACEETSPSSAKVKLDAALAKLSSSGKCSATQLSNAGLEESVIFGSSPLSLDGQNNQVFCDSTSGLLIGDDDTGSVPNSADNLKCALTVGKMVSKLVASTIKCHDKMNKAFFKGLDFDEESCEETNSVSHAGALDRFNQQRDKLAALSICPPCLDSSALDTLAANALAQVDAANAIGYPCNLGP